MATEGHSSTARVRASLLEYRQTGRRRGGYPPELRERACRCATDMRARGRSITEIAAELGVTAATASSWIRSAKTDSSGDDAVSFVPLVVDGDVALEPEPEHIQGQLEITFPSGVVLRIQEASRAAVVAAITQLARRES